ncbi:hypothetical protein E8E13_007089 [Curvularia kusanoi]|uniref:Cas1p 10 TM acyl transferase domain-containing protein n=1 Tax=Curvularia kusanoi TaxID=90978 RepID=A0A9P4T8M4_CURKU|nr:hypothetical protein E8E13_007089 [Curvularia kusanoi]
MAYDKTDLYHCNKLLSQGQWLDSPDRNPERKPFQNWQVPGCLLRDYTASDIADCNEDGQVLFIGDTTVRQVFWAAAQKLDRDWVSDRQQERHKHEDLHLVVDNARLSFIWDPWLNGTAFHEELKAYMVRNKPGNTAEEKMAHPSDGRRRSVLLFIGGGLWHARHLGDAYLPRFNHVVDRVAAVMSTTHDRLTSPGNILAHEKDGVDDQIFFAPVPDPIVERLSPSRENTITGNKIRAMNDHLQLWSNRGLNVPWSYRDMTANWPETVGESGLHVMDRLATQMANVVLNYRCNAKAAQTKGYPLDGTCCSAYRPTNWVQIATAIAFAPLLAFVLFKRYLQTSHQRSPNVLLADALVVMVLAAAYCYIVDRTHVFDKIPKEFANIDFRVMLGLAVLLCLPNVQSVSSTITRNRKRSLERSTQPAAFLPREQSDEFKGWMQIYVLVYAYTGASSVMDFYKVFRVFVALYLLLSGYGHATYFLRTGDFSAARVLGVVLRINTLPVILALAMNRPYTSYHFAPLVTFWFLIVVLTLRIVPSWNGHLKLLVVKVAVAALCTHIFIHAPGLLETLTGASSILFRSSTDVGGMRSHLSMDMYVVFIGVLIAAVHLNIRSILRTPYKQLSFPSSIIKRYFAIHQLLLNALATTAIPIFWILTQRSKTHDDYNWWMPYTAWIPALAFVLLRNSTAFLRARYCVSFAWLGRISLELYLLSQHIWLAGDSRGLLRIGFRYGNGSFLGDKWRDLVILTLLLVCCAWKVNRATKAFTLWVIYGKAGLAGLEKEAGGEDEAAVELPGWHAPEGEVEARSIVQKMELRKFMIRTGGVVLVVWLVNLLYP